MRPSGRSESDTRQVGRPHLVRCASMRLRAVFSCGVIMQQDNRRRLSTFTMMTFSYMLLSEVTLFRHSQVCLEESTQVLKSVFGLFQPSRDQTTAESPCPPKRTSTAVIGHERTTVRIRQSIDNKGCALRVTALNIWFRDYDFSSVGEREVL